MARRCGDAASVELVGEGGMSIGGVVVVCLCAVLGVMVFLVVGMGSVVV